MTSVFDMEVHPSAAIFPMLADDELDELAADIKANGLLHPIVVKDGVLIDGKNRREACRRAGVIPEIKEFPADADPVEFIIGANVLRKHYTDSQRAMGVAMLYPEPAKGGRGKTTIPEIKQLQVNPGLLSMARTVFRWSPRVAREVMHGATPLTQAYDHARKCLQEAKDAQARHHELRCNAPDLASLVADGELEIEAAEAVLRERRERVRIDNVRIAKLFEALEHWADAFEGEFADKVLLAAVHGARESDPRALLERWHRNISALLSRDEWA